MLEHKKQGALRECTPIHGQSHAVKKSTVDIPYKWTAGPNENTLPS